MELKIYMGNPSPHLQLHIPALDRSNLSICEANPQGLSAWIGHLPKANLGETARQLYQCLVELNRLETPASNRWRLMELLRPEVLFVCKHLEKHFLNQSVVLEERPRKVANLCQALQNHLITGYKLIVVQEAQSFRKEQPQQLAAALQRSLASMFGPLVRASQLYCPVPEGLWLEMHLLYQTACSFAIEHQPVADPLSYLKATQTCQSAYLAALLLGCARTNQMRQNAIANLAEVIAAWTPLVALETAESPSARFWVATLEDMPPRRISLFKDSEKHDLLGLNPTQLLGAIEEYLQSDTESADKIRLPTTERLKPEQIQHLGAAWGDTTERAFRRIPAQGSINICIGMTSVHYFLAGEKSFGDSLKKPKEAGNATFKSLKKGANDIWSKSFDAQPAAGWTAADQVEDINYDSPDDPLGNFGGHTDTEKYPTYPLLMINHSPSGYCLSWPREVPGQLQAGELLGLQDTAKKGWNLAVVRWIHQVRGGGTQMGVELLAPSARPCGLQLVRKAEESSQFLRALLLPEIKAIARPSALITPRLPFREGSRVSISLDGIERRALLGNRQAVTGSFSQFEFQELDSTSLKLEGGLKDNMSGSQASEEDFDSLWKSL